MFRVLLSLALAATTVFAVTIPRPAREFVILTPSGPKRLAQYRGKVVALALIQTTCEHCQLMTPVLSRIQAAYGPKGVQVLGGAFNGEAKTNLSQFIRTYKPSFPVGLAEEKDVIEFTQVTREMRPTAPILVVIDRQGMVRSQFLGADPLFQRGDQGKNIRAELDKYLK
jgi:thiol-disulfide isomerase/thioredoxin